MELSNQIILIGSGLLLLSILASIVSSRLGAPILLVFLGLGMLAGEDGPGGIRFDDVQTSHLVGTLALAIILFDGGMRTRVQTFRVGLWPAISLATLGVIITSTIIGAIAAWALHIPLLQGMLIGAIIGSTDAAAVFSLLHAQGSALKQRVAATLEIESGSNDPMAIFLTLALIELLIAGKPLTFGIVPDFIYQFGVGAALGLGGGKLLVWLINRLQLATGLYPLLALAGGVLIFATTSHVGASGFLAIYLAGLVLGNTRLQAAQHILRVHDGMAWLSQIGMFLILGLLVTPSELVEIAPQAILIALALVLLARPVAVTLSLLPFRFPWREHVFIGWVGLRGAVPVVLAMFPLMAGLENAELFFNVAFFVVLVSLVVQGWTIAPAARVLRLEVPPVSEPMQRINLDIPGEFEHELFGYRIAAGCMAAGRTVMELPLPAGTHVTTVARNGSVLELEPGLRLLAGDHVYITAVARNVPPLNRLFDPHRVPERLEENRFFGSFVLNGEAALDDIEALYGISFAGRRNDDNLASYLTRIFHRRPVVGDRFTTGRAQFVVRETDDNRISTVGLRLH